MTGSGGAPRPGTRSGQQPYEIPAEPRPKAADAGDWEAADQLAERGDLDELRARADAGDKSAAYQLAVLLARRGDLDELRARADTGDGAADQELAELLARRGDLEELRARTDAGSDYAGEQLTGLLTDLLIKQGRAEEAEQLLRFRPEPGRGRLPAGGIQHLGHVGGIDCGHHGPPGHNRGPTDLEVRVRSVSRGRSRSGFLDVSLRCVCYGPGLPKLRPTAKQQRLPLLEYRRAASARAS